MTARIICSLYLVLILLGCSKNPVPLDSHGRGPEDVVRVYFRCVASNDYEAAKECWVKRSVEIMNQSRVFRGFDVFCQDFSGFGEPSKITIHEDKGYYYAWTVSADGKRQSDIGLSLVDGEWKLDLGIANIPGAQ